MANGILALLAGLAGGLAKGAQAKQQRQLDEEYKKALIEHNKMQAKLAEQKINLDYLQYQQGIDKLKWLMGGGQGAPPIPQEVPQPPGQAPMGAIPTAPSGGKDYGQVQQLMGGGVIPQARAQAMGQPYPSETQPGQVDFIKLVAQKSEELGLPPVALAGIAGNLLHESGGNPGISHDGGAGIGIAGWSGPRRQALREFAASQGKPETDLVTQIAFMTQELKSPEFQGLVERLKNAKTPQEAAILFSNEYERPGKPMLENRIRLAAQAHEVLRPLQRPAQGQGARIDPNSPYYRAIFKEVFKIDPKSDVEVKGDKAGGYIVFENGMPVARYQGPMGIETYEARDPNTGTPYRVYQRAPGMDGRLEPPIAYVPTGPSAERQAQLEALTKKIQDEITGLPPETAGKANLINNAVKRLQEANRLIFNPDGTINKEVILKGSAPLGGIGQGRTLYSKMRQAINAALRLESGAAITQQEIDEKIKEFWPTMMDLQNPETVYQKMKDFNEYIRGAVQLTRGGSPNQTLGVPPGPPQPAAAPKTAKEYLKLRGLQ